MNWLIIEQLLNRFWDGETSLEEEQKLKRAFLREDLPSQLLPFQKYFIFTQTQRSRKHPQEDFEAQLSTKLNPIKKNYFSGSKVLAYAASLLIFISSLFFLFNEHESIQYKPLTEKEMQVAQKYLSFLADNMEESLAMSTNNLNKLHLLNSGASTLEHFETTYDKQIKKLSNIEHLDNTFTQLKYLKTFKNSRIKL